jgi:hypothetical protein
VGFGCVVLFCLIGDGFDDEFLGFCQLADVVLQCCDEADYQLICSVSCILRVL